MAEIYQIIDFQHVKPGKGGAFVRTKLRRMRTSGTIDKTFRSGEKVDPIYIEKVNYQYLYRQGSELVLMDLDSYEQIPVPETQIGDGAKYLKKKWEIMALVAGDEVLGYEVPNFVELVVEQTDPAEATPLVAGGQQNQQL
ncbi:MAG: hypothetical protein R2688_10840 [Fimbriimonadaceae bacterium]